MSDWRPSGGRRRQNQDPAPSPPPTPSQPPPPDQPRESWRRRNAGGSRATAGKSYLDPGANDGDEVARAKLIRGLKILVSLGCLLAAMIWFVIYVFFSAPETPLVLVHLAEETAVRENPQDPHLLFPTPYQVELGLSDDAGFLSRVNEPNLRFHRADIVPTKINDDQHVKLAMEWGSQRDRYRIVAFYIAGTAIAAEHPSDDLWVLGSEGDPYRIPDNPGAETQLPSWRAVSLKTLLTQLVEQTPNRKAKVLVFLELTQPPPILEIGRLQNPIPARIRAAHRGLEEKVKKRLGIVMSCREGEENWSAPELGRTVFGHYVARALAGEADGYEGARRSKKDKKVTVEELTSYLEDNVADWAARFRRARQTPEAIFPEKASDLLSLTIAKTAGQDSLAAADPAPKREEMSNRLAELNSLWNRYRQYRDDPTTDPIELGILESRLIRLEQLAVQGKRVSTALWDLAPPPAKPPQPVTGSLYERTDLQRSEIDAEFRVWQTSAPPFLRPPPEKDEEPVAPKFSTVVENTYLVWRWLVTQCEDSPNQTIRETTLKGALNYLDNSNFEGGSSTPWQERQLLNLLASEIDWEQFEGAEQLDQLSRAVSLLIRCRHRIQSNAIATDPEVHFWIRDDVDTYDRTWRLAFDKILASRLELCLEAETELQRLERRLYSPTPSTDEALTLTEKTDVVVNALSVRDQAFKDLPHLLRWSLLQLQLEDQDRIRQRLEKIRKAFDTTTALASQLRSPDSTTMKNLAETSSKLRDSISDLNNEFDEFVKGIRVDNREAIRTIDYRYARIALQSPLISAEERENLYTICQSYWNSFGNQDVSKGIVPPEVDWSKELNQFRSIESATGQWQRLTQSLWSPEIFEVSEWRGIDERESGIKNHAGILDAEQQVRPFALFLGEYLPGLNEATSLRGMIADRYKLARIEAHCWLASRAIHDMWGDGQQFHDTPYFSRLAKHYRDAAPQLQDYRRTRINAAEELSRKQTEYLADAQMRWEKQDVDLLPMANKVPMPFKTPATEPLEPAVASVYVIADNSRFPFLDASGQTVRGMPVSLDVLDQSRSLTLPLDDVQLPFEGSYVLRGTTALRGNHLRRDLRLHVPPPESNYRTVRFDRYEQPAPQLRLVGRAKGVFRVALVVDGSASTKKPTKSLESLDSSILDELKKAAETEVLAKLRAIDEAGEAQVQVKLVLFGDVPGTLEDSPLGAKRRTLRSRTQVASWIVTTEFRRASANNIAEMVDLIRSLKAAKATPLFDAITTALEADNVSKPDDHRAIVIALTDGVNNTNHIGQIGLDTLKTNIRNYDVPVHVLEYDNLAYYEDNEMTDQYRAGKSDMETMDTELGERFKYFQTGELAKFRKAIEELVPRIEYKIMAKGAAENDPPIVPPRKLNDAPVNLGALKLPAEVVVRVGNAVVRQPLTRELKILGGEWFQLDYVGPRSQLEFPDHKSNNGITIPSRFSSWESTNPDAPKLNVWLHKPVEDIGPKQDAIGVVTSFRSQDETKFTPRPTFLLAEVRRSSGNQAERVFDVYDYQYLPSDRWRAGEHYPFARFAEIPWYDKSERRPRTQANVSLWIAYQMPPNEKVLLETGQDARKKQLGSDEFTLQWTGSTVRVSVRSQAPGNPVDRWIVIIPDVVRVERSYSEDGTAVEHVFRLPADQGGQVEVQIMNVKETQQYLDPPVRFEPSTIGKR